MAINFSSSLQSRFYGMPLRLYLLFGLLTLGLFFQADFACAKAMEIEAQATSEDAAKSIARLKALQQSIKEFIPVDVAKKHAGVIRNTILQKSKDLTELEVLKTQMVDNHYIVKVRVSVKEDQVKERLAQIPEIKTILEHNPPKVAGKDTPKPTGDVKPAGASGPSDAEFLALIEKKADAKLILAAIRNHANVNAEVQEGQSKGMSALMLYLSGVPSGQKANLEIVKAMLASGAKADWVSADKNLSLMRVAITKQDPDLLLLLLKAKPDLSWTGQNTGQTLLHSWLEQNQNKPEILKAFLDAGFNPNAKRADQEYQTPVLFDCIKTQGIFVIRPLEFLKLMLAAGANPNITDANQDTALIYAVKANAEEQVKFLLTKGVQVAAVNNLDETALIVACESYVTKLEIVKALINGGADPNVAAAKRHGLTPLVAAVRVGRVDLIQALLKAGAKIDAPLPDKRTALSCAVEANNLEIAKLLLEAGANPNVVDQSSYVPLVYALANQNLDLIKLLMAKGADANVQVPDDNKQVTLKAMLQKYGSPEIRAAF